MFFRKSAETLAARVVELARGGAPAPELQQAMKDCLHAAQRAKAPEREAALAALVPALSVPSDNHAFAVAFLCGAFVEDGCSPAPVEELLVQRYLALVAAARKFHAAVEPTVVENEDDPDAAFAEAAQRLAPSMREESTAFDRLGQQFGPAVAVLSASPSARRRFRSMGAELSAMAEDNAGAGWLEKLCAVLDGEPYLAIEPATGLGIRGRMDGVAENFQLNVLLMDVFPRPDGQRSRRVSRSRPPTRAAMAPSRSARPSSAPGICTPGPRSRRQACWSPVPTRSGPNTGSGTRGRRRTSRFSMGSG